MARPDDGYRYEFTGTIDRFKLFRELEAHYPNRRPTGPNDPAILVEDTDDGVVVWTRDPVNEDGLATVVGRHDPTPEQLPPTAEDARRAARLARIEAIPENNPAVAIRALKDMLKDLHT